MKMSDLKDLALYQASEIDEEAKKQGQNFRFINENQLRNFYTAIVRMRIEFQNSRDGNYESVKRNLILLKPKLAYAAGRDRRNLLPFKDFMTNVIDKAVTSRDLKVAFDNFFALTEAIIAYHKFYSENKNIN
jgi:CRISPR-associated protein Csm2